MQTQQEAWQTLAKAKVAATKSEIPQEWVLGQADLEDAKNQRQLSGPFIEKFLDKEELEIIRNDSVPLVEKIASGQYTALQVTRAYCKTAAIAHQINPCLHEILFASALSRARELDAHFSAHKTPQGPLHGLPVSLKDQFHVRGADTTMGYVGWIGTHEGDRSPGKARSAQSQLVGELLSLGAVLYCKRAADALARRDRQQLDRADVESGQPASVLRGFVGRDVANTNPGQTTHPSSVGFMSTSIDALRLVMASVLSTQPWLRDPEVISIPWRQEIADSTLERASPDGAANDRLPLKLGIYWTDGVVGPHPPVLRGLHTVLNAVKKAGHKVETSHSLIISLLEWSLLMVWYQKVVDWNPPLHSTARGVHWAFLMADGAHDIHKQLSLSGEPLIPDLEEWFQLRDPINLLEYQDLTLQGRDYCEAYSDYWNSTADGDQGQ
ncbi:hypothetical protein FGG08_007084 [Glutinoglossum americanum]|uniref:Amidase domain-containing protein n=1 Tax=Glutinoglossum americanum TaxID=1670608 RepID=A0A9P8HX09_9PEZI|nr:hypothetical protein FGG08_007084 [Glutinoglossum americanum]